MPRILSLIMIMFCILSLVSLSAQEEDPDSPHIDSDWYDYYEPPYARGDRTFNISMGILIPAYFSGIDNNSHGLSIGGVGTLSYNYFLSSNIFLGAEISGSFSGTRGGNMLYLIPFGARAGYQFYFRQIEIPISITIGASTQRYVNNDYFGLILKPGISAYYRYNMDWSFGLNTNWWVLPQWPRNGNNVVGNFFELTLSARYHF